MNKNASEFLMKIFRISTIPLSLNILLKGQLKYLDSFFDITAVSGPGKDLDEVKKREGVKVNPIKIHRNISLFSDVVSLIQLYRYFKKEKPDIIHSITPKAGLLSMVAGKWAGVPVRMHTFTGLIFPYRSGMLRLVLVFMDRILCRHATHIYPEGQGVKEQLLENRITDKPLKVLANGNVNGIDTAYFSTSKVSPTQIAMVKTELGISNSAFVFVFIGRLVKDKGINELVTTFKRLSSEEIQSNTDGTYDYNENLHLTERLSELKLLLVGPFEQHLNPLTPATLEEIEHNPNIIAVGFQTDVRPYLAVSDALVFPSYREGFPNVVMQAGAMGLPAIVTDINGCNEIIIEGQNGTIIPPKNTSALQNAMQRMLTDDPWRTHLKQNARPMITSRYEQQLVWDALLEEYRTLLTPQ